MHSLTLPIKNLWRHPLRSGLTMLGVCGAVAGFVVLVSMSRGVEVAWVECARRRGVHMTGFSRDAVEMLTGSMDVSRVREIAAVAGVSDAMGELVDLVRLDPPDDQVQVILRGWPEGSFAWDMLSLERGGAPRENSVVIGCALAQLLELEPGNVIRIKRRELNIAGIAAPAGIMNDMCVIMPLTLLQTLSGREQTVNQFRLRLTNPGDTQCVRDVQRRLEEQFEDLAFHTTDEMAHNNGILRIFRALTWSISLVGMIMAGIIILNTLLITVTERTREIGLLSAVGWSSRRIMLLIVAEGACLTSLGALAGVVLGVPALHGLLLLPSLYGLFEPSVSRLFAVEVFVVSLLMGCLGSLYPAWRAMRLAPVDALRSE